MDIRRIVTNISSEKMEESKEFYTDFLGLNIVMDLTFASASNPAAQITIVKKVKPNVADSDITIFVEVNDIDNLYARAIALDYKIAYPITNESWGVRRFFVKDPNGVIINLMCHLPSSNKQ
jgi:catechol 2,3-dioxygenase-like lactoylglutathione lyase family enzyme